MAEVLITLGIIGVVAAMTIPTLITKVQHIQYRVAYRKAYSVINQALKTMADDGEVLDLNIITGHGAYNIGENFKKLATYYIKTSQTCFDNNADKCWVCETGEAGYLYGGAPKWLGCWKASYAFIDMNGTGWYLYNNVEFPILIDVNGNRGPNQLGRDRFVFRFANSMEQNKVYDIEINSVIPWHDIKGKTRWCPQGNCLYKTWIQGNK